MTKKVLIVFACCLSFYSVLAQDKKNQWVDSVFQTLTTREKVGQLFVVPASSYFESDDIHELEELVKGDHPGGILISGGGPVGTTHLINRLQRISSTPLLVMIDAESGPGKTLDSLTTFPNPLALGAIANDSLIYLLGAEIARQMQVMGMHVNFVPNADVNVTAGNPNSYFGSNKYKVAHQSIALMRGLQDHGVIACAKQSSLPTILGNETEYLFDFTNNKFDTSIFYTYDKLIKGGIGGILTSNLHFSIQDKKELIPASISQLFIGDLLKNKIGFSGLTIADIPYFHNLAGKSKVESDKLAFEVGNDLLMNPYNLNASIRRIENAIKKNIALRLKLDGSVKKILAAKYDAKLNHYTSVDTDNLMERVNSIQGELLKRKLTEASITVVENKDSLVPIQDLDEKKFASLSLGSGKTREFNTYLNKYAHFDTFKVETVQDTTSLIKTLLSYDVIVVSLYSLTTTNGNALVNWLNSLTKKKNLILCSFGNPYDLSNLNIPTSLILAYTENSPAPMVTAQMIFGARQVNGKTPIAVGNLITENQGIISKPINRLSYDLPEQVGMDSKVLAFIDRIVKQAIDSGATPGCNIIVARNGRVVYDKAIGWKTYDKEELMTPETIYDLASITKVAATLQTVMFMYEKNLIDINKKVSVYLPELKETNKKDFTFKDILTHQAGLWPYLPFWLQTMKDTVLLPEYYSHIQTEEYSLPVAKDLFTKKTMKDSLWHWILQAKIREKKPRTPFDYTYSDMGFYIMQHVAEKLLSQPMQDFLAQNLYEPMGATTTGFLPLERFPESQIAPTEIDSSFRGSKLVGYVHDQGSALHGGVAGHAGLFSNANDLAKLGQMWLQKGNYGGIQFYKPETIDFFTGKQYASSRRGLGWDKPTQSDWNGPTSLFASQKTFGHTGFTGTAIWVDPEFDLVFVFLSNRVYPDMLNTKLLSGNIRPRIQDVIYQSIFEYCKSEN